MICALRDNGPNSLVPAPTKSTEDLWGVVARRAWPTTNGVRKTSHPAEPHRCQFRTRVLPANTLNGELTRHGSTGILPILVDPGTEAGRRAVGDPAVPERNAVAPQRHLELDPQPTSCISREAVPALFGVLKLRQYLCSHVRMTLLVWMHVECVPICLIQIDLDRKNIVREDFAR